MQRLHVILACLALVLPAAGSDEFSRKSSEESRVSWHVEHDLVSASIEGWPVEKLLQIIGGETGWLTFVEPEMDHTVSTRFKNLPSQQALRRLLSNLNFAVIPQPAGPAKLVVYKTALSKATKRVLPVVRNRKPKPADNAVIPNELIVTLKDKANVDIEALARQLGARVAGRIDGTNTYRLVFDDAEQADKARVLLDGNAGVEGIDSNFRIARPEPMEVLPIGPPPLNLRPAKNDPNSLVVGLVDSAVQNEGTRVGAFLLPEVNVLGSSRDEPLDLSHGTSMAETILHGLSSALDGKAETTVRILPVDVYGQLSDTTTFDVARGVQAAIQNGADIVSMSLGSPHESGFLKSIIQSGNRQGVLFVAAAGNEPTGMPVYPAAHPEVIGVTAAGRRGGIAVYANHGSFVDVAAPGSGVTVFQNQTYFGTGTSFSAAHVSGLAAGIGSSQGLSMEEVSQKIKRDLGIPKP